MPTNPAEDFRSRQAFAKAPFTIDGVEIALVQRGDAANVLEVWTVSDPEHDDPDFVFVDYPGEGLSELATEIRSLLS